EVVVFAREAGRLAGDVGEERRVVAVERLPGGGGDPVGAFERHVHPLVAVRDEVGAVAGALEVLPVDRQLLASAVHAGPGAPVDLILPGIEGGDAPGAEGAPVVGDVARED